GAIGERLVHLLDLQLNDIQELVVLQLIEDDYLVKAVDEFRVERLANSRHDHLFQFFARGVGSRLKAHRPLLLNEARADIRGHDDDRILEINGVTERVRQDAVFKDLKQDIEDIRVSFLNLIEEQDRVW